MVLLRAAGSAVPPLTVSVQAGLPLVIVLPYGLRQACATVVARPAHPRGTTILQQSKCNMTASRHAAADSTLSWPRSWAPLADGARHCMRCSTQCCDLDDLLLPVRTFVRKIMRAYFT
jgi:hypothetical protein